MKREIEMQYPLQNKSIRLSNRSLPKFNLGWFHFQNIFLLPFSNYLDFITIVWKNKENWHESFYFFSTSSEKGVLYKPHTVYIHMWAYRQLTWFFFCSKLPRPSMKLLHSNPSTFESFSIFFCLVFSAADDGIDSIFIECVGASGWSINNSFLSLPIGEQTDVA